VLILQPGPLKSGLLQCNVWNKYQKGESTIAAKKKDERVSTDGAK